ncbi:hypothetical protein L226DRAFT_370946 [Lentinus tigrinus ALCF2SS1-7]|uniref:F-box domain-containing protein n=1 Tax=Lentinus tigrinus ALCF2SS1-6 TaxID=1328759 RepID=A0A5C2SJX9_9APHY|nr:hypothetical protein L227DRAFT_316155 [Lentinus tigrinus ALCF2SS1-6]RPD76244.1 hypothetical protein L226DRAFT_370946 [Lentinus tigrinus ALCF2SS1-7]
MRWLSTTSASNLEELEISIALLQAPPSPILDLVDGPECRSFFQMVGSSVSWLTLEITGGMAIPLSYFTNLSELILAATVQNGMVPPITWNQVCSSLSQLRSRLRYLRLWKVEYREPSCGGNIFHVDRCLCLTPGPDIEELDAVLAQDIFKNLGEVEFHLVRTFACPTDVPSGWVRPGHPPCPPLSLSELLPHMRKAMPQLYARGIITFTSDETWIYRHPAQASTIPPTSPEMSA